MHSRAEWLQRRRELVWEHGRQQRNRLLFEYSKAYGASTVPPPAKVIDELLTDFLGAELRYGPLPSSVFAQTEWISDTGKPRVTVNSMTADIEGVRDAEGVQNVAKWHETMHVVDDLHVVRLELQRTLPGFTAPKIVCHRSPEVGLAPEVRKREFLAEEAGRAAAVCHEALAQSEAFLELCHLAARSCGPIPQAWPLLYRSAADIGVNISALTRQLSLEGRISLQGPGGREVHVQPALIRLVKD
jgi:hypothetical protein